MKALVSNFKDINKILDLIHDQYFNINDIHYNSERRYLEIKFEREDNEREKLLKNILFLKKYNVPLRQAILRIHHVESFEESP